MIAEYLEKTKVSFYMNNLLMEFIQSAQRTHFERIFSSQHINGDQLEIVMADEENRRWAIEEAIQKNQYLTLSWDIRTEASFTGKNYKLILKITNHGIINESLKVLHTQKTRETNLNDLTKISSEISHLLIKNIEEICKKEKISFRSSINPDVLIN